MTDTAPRQFPSPDQVADTEPPIDTALPSEAPPVVNRPSTGMTGPEPTREQYVSQLGDAQLLNFHQRVNPTPTGDAISQVLQTAPWTRQAPDFIVPIVQDSLAKGNFHDMLGDLQDASTFMSIVQMREALQRQDEPTQDQQWNLLPRAAQQVLANMGYTPPATQRAQDAAVGRTHKESGIGDALLGALSDAGDAILNAKTDLPGDFSLKDVASEGLHDLGLPLRAAQTIYRLNSGGKGGLDPMPWNFRPRALADSNGAFKLEYSDLAHPSQLLSVWRRAWNGEKVFDGDTAQKVSETFQDQRAFQLATRLANQESPFDIAKDYADPISDVPGYQDAVKQILAFSAQKNVQDAIGALTNARISIGRDTANRLMLPAGSPEYSLVSGASDAAFDWFADPAMIAGKAYKASLAARFGLDLVHSTDAAQTVLNRYLPGLDAAAAARDVSEVGTPGYRQALATMSTNPEGRMATMMADHLAQGKAAELYDALGKGSGALVKHLSEASISTPMDVARYFASDAGLTALTSGEAVTYKSRLTQLPHLTRLGASTLAAKVNWNEAIDFLANAKVSLAGPVDELDRFRLGDPDLLAGGNADSVLGAVGQQARLLLSPMARAAQHLTNEALPRNVINFGSNDIVDHFGTFLDYGVRGQQRRDLLNALMRAPDEASQRAVVGSGIRSVFANLGLLDDPALRNSDFVKQWIDNTHAYALDGIDRLPNGGAFAIDPEVDVAHQMALPSYRNILGEVRRQRFASFATGITSPDTYEKALSVWRPVEAGIEHYMRFWQQAAIMRPALALRQGLSGSLEQYGRLGPGHTLKQWLLMRGEAADPALASLGDEMFHGGSTPFDLVPDVVRRSVASEGEKVAQQMEGLLDRAGMGTLDLADRRAFREPLVVDTVGDAFNRVAHARVGLPGDYLTEDPSAFLSVPQMRDGNIVDVGYRKVGGPYTEMATGEPVGRHALANQVQHLTASSTHQAAAAVRTGFVDEVQAARLAEGLGTSVDGADNFAKVAAARAQLAELPDSVRRPLTRYVDRTSMALRSGEAFTQDELSGLLASRADEAVAAGKLSAQQAATVRRFAVDPERIRMPGVVGIDGEAFDLGSPLAGDELKAVLNNRVAGAVTRREMTPAQASVVKRLVTDVNQSDGRALLWDPAHAFDAIPEADRAAHWPDLLDRMQQGDRQAWRDLENEVRIARASQPDIEPLMHDLVRMGPANGVIEDQMSPNVQRAIADRDQQKALVDRLAAIPATHPYELDYHNEILADREATLNHATQGKTWDEAMQEWAAVHQQQLDQSTLTGDGRVVHGITGPMSEGRIDPRAAILEAEHPLPPRTVAPAIQEIKGRNLGERMVNGFWNWTGNVIRDMSRRPLWQKEYADAYREANAVFSPLMRDPELAAQAGAEFAGHNLDDVSDVFRELQHRIEEAHRAGATTMRTIGDLGDDDLRGMLDAHGLPSDVNTDVVRDWWGNEDRARQHISQVAADRATRAVVPFIEDPSVRSQAAEGIRYLSPFFWAEQQFYQRWARTFVQAPEALRRVQLLHHAMNATGFLDHNENGDEVLNLPGAPFVTKAIANMIDLLPQSIRGKAGFALPIAAPLTGQLSHALPGFDPNSSWPHAGPLLSAPMALLAQIAPSIGAPLEGAVAGDVAQGQTPASAIVPAIIRKAWDVSFGFNKEQAASTITAAMQMMEANGHGISETVTLPDGTVRPATGEERQQQLDRLVNQARVIGITKLLYGLVSPMSPSTAMQPVDLNTRYSQLVRAMGVNEGVAQFLREHPDATAYTVFGSESPSKAPTDPSAEAYDTLLHHGDFVSKYSSTAAWFLPEVQPGAPETAFSRQAWNAMLADQVRVQKGPDQMMRDLKFAQDSPRFFEMQKQVEQVLAQVKGDSAATQRVNQYWSDQEKQYFALHPIFAEEYQSSDRKQQRASILTEMRSALADPERPDVPQADYIAKVIDSYDRTSKWLATSSVTDKSSEGAASRTAVREAFDNWATTFTASHPTAQTFYLRIIKPDLRLPSSVGAS